MNIDISCSAIQYSSADFTYIGMGLGISKRNECENLS